MFPGHNYYKMIEQFEITLPSFPRGFHLIDYHLNSILKKLPEKGLIHLFLKHTSASLCLNENADPSVRMDFEMAMNRIVPEHSFEYSHDSEGLDDMPSHIKSALFGQSLTIPITSGKPNLGTWQGIYLCEFRNHGGPRRIVLTIYY